MRLLALLGLITLVAANAHADTKDACVDCHGEAKLLVQNRKLYDYFRHWQVSAHGLANITCVECHGGNPKATTKAAAHAGSARTAASPESAINFRNIPNMCASCHESEAKGYRQSSHFEHLNAKGGAEQGPNCVTCHGSMTTRIVDATTVRTVCETCHNAKTGNHVDIPERAAHIINRFLSIDRFYRYVSRHGQYADTKAFLDKVDPERATLSGAWHTFDLDVIEARTEALLTAMKQQRELIQKGTKPEPAPKK